MSKKFVVACIGAIASAAVSAANVAPIVSLGAPANNSSFVSPGVLVLQASASDSDGTISKVQFYDGSTLLGTDTTAPYTFTWTNPAVAIHKLTVKATDNVGAVTTSAAVTLTVNANKPPSISLLGPAANVYLVAPASITLSASAADADGSVVKVAYYNGSTLIGSATSAPWSVAWTGENAGAFTITAKATDDKGAVATSAARTVTLTKNQAPTVSVATPTANASFAVPAAVALTANAADSDGSVTEVRYYNGATLIGSATAAPFAVTWNNSTAGTYSLTAKATDDKGAVTTSAARSVTLKANVLPTVSISSPAANASFAAPAAIQLQANAADADGSVVKVEYFNGAIAIGSATTAPFAVTWNTAALGQFSITAKATDNAGAVKTSSAVRVTVKANTAPGVAIVTPVNNATYAAPAAIALSANASDADGTVARVDYFNGTLLIGSATTTPYTFIWNAGVGSYALSARVIDDKGDATTSAAVNVGVVNNTAPTVAIAEPLNNAVLVAPASFVLRASAMDSDGTISKIDFYNGATLIGSASSAPYAVNITGLPAGDYTLQAKASDNFGATTSATAQVKVRNNALPTVSLVANVSTATAPASIILTATAADADGTIASVGFFDGTALIATVTHAPYTFTATAPVAGTYNFSAKATDDLGGGVISNSVGVEVAGGAQAVYFINADHLGTPRVVIDAANGEVWKWQVGEPFGYDLPNEDPRNTQRQFRFNLRFPGQYFDSETGLHYNYYRDYDPQTGRYIQSDPIGLAGGINTYAYVSANPVSFTDAQGLQSLAACASNPAAAATCAEAGIGMASSRIDISKLVTAAKTVAELCSKCYATASRSQAQAAAFAFAGIAKGSSSSSPTPWSNSNFPGGPDFKKSRVYAEYRAQYRSTDMGWSDGKQQVEEHPFGHPDLPGGLNHNCPHFWAMNSSGVEQEFPYKPGSH